MLLAKANFGQNTYSVIGQGMVDTIVNYSPQERKSFFDEATGVKQFQIKRDRSVNKLKKSRENLTQVKSLVAELEPHLKSLTRQVNRLQKRKEVEAELKDLQTQYYGKLWLELDSSYQNLVMAFTSKEKQKIKLDNDLEGDDLPVSGKGVQTSETLQSKINGDGNGKRPRWLRVQIVNTKTGKNKFSVNVPFGVVKFGLGIARVFSPEMDGVDFDEIGELISNADAGLLVDVQDEDSNEHVKIFFD